LAIRAGTPNLTVVTKPLAVIFYERLLPGSRVANRLSDLGWRVAEAKRPEDIVPLARAERALVVLAEFAGRSSEVCLAVAELKRTPETEHVPVLGYGDPKDLKLSEAALAAGVSLVVAEAGVFDQLPQLLDHVLAVD
jgi:PleD family two-component response regulator